MRPARGRAPLEARRSGCEEPGRRGTTARRAAARGFSGRRSDVHASRAGGPRLAGHDAGSSTGGSTAITASRPRRAAVACRRALDSRPGRIGDRGPSVALPPGDKVVTVDLDDVDAADGGERAVDDPAPSEWARSTAKRCRQIVTMVTSAPPATRRVSSGSLGRWRLPCRGERQQFEGSSRRPTTTRCRPNPPRPARQSAQPGEYRWHATCGSRRPGRGSRPCGAWDAPDRRALGQPRCRAGRAGSRRGGCPRLGPQQHVVEACVRMLLDDLDGGPAEEVWFAGKRIAVKLSCHNGETDEFGVS